MLSRKIARGSATILLMCDSWIKGSMLCEFHGVVQLTVLCCAVVLWRERHQHLKHFMCKHTRVVCGTEGNHLHTKGTKPDTSQDDVRTQASDTVASGRAVVTSP